jgi:hypothetical protein
MKLNIFKRHAFSYLRKTNVLSYEYPLFHAAITRTNIIKDPGVFHSKLHFYKQAVFSECMELYGFILIVTLKFSAVDCLCVLYFRLVRPKLQCASVFWNFIMSTDSKGLDRIEQKFASLCSYRCFMSLMVVLISYRIYICILYVNGTSTWCYFSLLFSWP